VVVWLIGAAKKTTANKMQLNIIAIKAAAVISVISFINVLFIIYLSFNVNGLKYYIPYIYAIKKIINFYMVAHL